LTRSSVLRLWDASTGRQLVEFPGHEGSITSLSFTPDGHELVSAGGGTIQVWEASTGKHLRQLLGSSANVLAVLPDGHSVLSGGYDAMLHLLEIDSGQETRRFLIDKDIAPLLQDRHVVWSLGLSPDGKTAASYSMESVKNQGFLHVWDLTSGKALAINRVPSARLVFRLFSPDAKLLVRHEPINSPIPRNGRFDQVEENPPNAVVLQDSLTGKPVLSLPQMDQINIVQSFSSDGQVLATATYKAVRRGPDDREGPATIHIWELISGKERQTMAIPGEGDAHLQDLVFSPDQRVIATACSGWKSGAREHWIQLWDTVSGKELLRLSGYDSNTRKLAFSPDGRFLVSGHEEGYLLVWDVSPISPFKASKPKRVSSAELESCWADLAGEDAHKAGEAIWKLVDTGSQAVELFRSRLHPAPGPPADKMKQWIADLDSNDFERREEATRQLAALQDLAQPALKEVLKGKMSAEQRRRIEPLLQPYFLVNGPDKRQQLRSIQVLERIGTPEAQAVLAELAKGAPEARLTIAAKAAQERLSRSVLFKNNRENLTK